MSSSKKTSQTTSIPPWLEQGSQQATGIAQRIANRPFIQYGKDYSKTLASGAGPSGSAPAAPASTFDPSAWQQTNTRAGPIYTNPQTGENLSYADYQAKLKGGGASAAPGGAAAQPPSTFTPAEQAAMQLANSDRYAAIDPNEQKAYDMANAGSGYEADLAKARDLTAKGAGTFLDADMNAYMNPYIKGALDPAARELRQQIGADTTAAKTAAGNAGAFGGSRATLLETENKRSGTQAISDLYARGYHSAFEDAATRFNEDRNAAARGAEQYRALASQDQGEFNNQIGALLTTGGLARGLKQQGLDFNYDQFTQARDWDVNNLKPLLATLSSVPHSETTTKTQKGDTLSTVVGLGVAAFSAYTGNAAGVKGGMQMATGGGGDEPIQTAKAAMQNSGGTFDIGPNTISDVPEGNGRAAPAAFYNVNPTFTPAMVA